MRYTILSGTPNCRAQPIQISNQIDQHDGVDSFEEATVSTEKAYTSLDIREFEIIKND